MCSMLQLAQITFLIWSHCQISAGDVKSYLAVKYLHILSFLVVKHYLFMSKISRRKLSYFILLSTICKYYLLLLSNICRWCNLINYLQILLTNIYKYYLHALGICLTFLHCAFSNVSGFSPLQ